MWSLFRAPGDGVVRHLLEVAPPEDEDDTLGSERPPSPTSISVRVITDKDSSPTKGSLRMVRFAAGFATMGTAAALLLSAVVLRPGAKKYFEGPLAWVDVSGQLDRQPVASALYDLQNAPPNLRERFRLLRETVELALAGSPQQYYPLDLSVPMREDTLVTQASSSKSTPSISLGRGEVTIKGLMHDPPLIRAELVAPTLGWASLVNMDSFWRNIDREVWPAAGCPKPDTPAETDYIVDQDETPATASNSSRSEVKRVLWRNEVVHIVECQWLLDEFKVRGRLSDGTWVTIADQHSCKRPLISLPPVPPRALQSGGGTSPRKGSFLVIGDWGWDPDVHWTIKNRQCQENIALQMLQKFRELGDVRFVINVGDAFYPGGVTGPGDPQWQKKWRNVFHEELRNVPWYSVYGNHDLHVDPCACNPDPNVCAQVNTNTSDRSRFYMPAPSYFVEHPDMDLEVVATDFNKIGDPQVCKYTPCQAACEGVLNARQGQGDAVFWQRLKQSNAKNLVMFSHYPTDFLHGPYVGAMQADTRHSILYLGGHRHSTDDTSPVSISPHKTWLVGGGGGLGCDGPQGFLVGEIQADSTLKTYPIMVPGSICCSS